MMNEKKKIEQLSKNSPFKVPEDYFTSLTHDIMEKIDEKEKPTFLDFFTLKTFVPAFAIIVIIFAAFWYNNTNPTITNDDLIDLLSYYEMEDDLLYEYIALEDEYQEDDYLIDEFDYNELINEL